MQWLYIYTLALTHRIIVCTTPKPPALYVCVCMCKVITGG